ncbi:hypothetical protein XENOCAPTIV_008479 [Xenoophorus captivus]|uniref:Uncharacterized protein n=1 Tax=Xenoophorus captivus TaxID=1517983 RepID=A0ABV0RR87_9TELE
MAPRMVGSWVTGELVPPAVYGREAGYTLDGSPSIAGQHRDTQDKQPAHTHSHLRPNSHVFGLWDEVGVPRENPRMHRENLQKDPRRESNPGPACCEATVLPTAPPCSPKNIN